jgi:quercetin dioxygenase-like cupin family protein
MASILAKREVEKVQPSSEPGIFVKRSEITSRPPTAAFEGSRFWMVERSTDFSVGLGEISGSMPLHFHTDGEHRVTVVEGQMRLQLGHEERILNPGDYAVVPVGVPHKIGKGGTESTWFVTFDTPPMDLTNFHWLEAPPNRLEGCPLCPDPFLKT